MHLETLLRLILHQDEGVTVFLSLAQALEWFQKTEELLTRRKMMCFLTVCLSKWLKPDSATFLSREVTP